jgi:O-antigen ligase
MNPVLRRDALIGPLAVLGAALLGAIIAVKASIAVVLIGGALLVVVTFGFPIAHFALLLIATIIIPYELQNRYGIGGGTGAAGLVLSDVLLLSGLARAVYALAVSRLKLRTGEIVALLVLLLYLAITTGQFLRGALFLHYPLGEAGDEWRSVNGLSALIIALPLLREEVSRERLMKVLLGIGLVLGAWGIFQWVFQLGLTGDTGVRANTPGTGSGIGSLQGGLYGYPVAVCLSYAALLSGGLKTVRTRWWVGGCLLVNFICLLLTYERTFWLTTLLACGLITLRAGRAQRFRALIAAPIGFVVILAIAAVIFPGTVTAARERLFSLGQYASESSVSYRVIESQHMITQIKKHPLVGEGLGAPLWWGRPDSGVPPSINYFAHNGPLWIWWKIGIFGVIVLFGGIALAVLRRGRARGDAVFGMVSVGAQGALLALLLTNVTFPSVTARTITPTMGLLLALCALPRVRGAQASSVSRAAR